MQITQVEHSYGLATRVKDGYLFDSKAKVASFDKYSPGEGTDGEGPQPP